jgi:hypothetical protein
VIIDADDLGCVADGRWLREVSISAGSPAVTVPAGAVLAGDVDASITIPGAADMETTIELLPGAKTVVNTAIEPGDPTTLTVTLTGDEGPFVPKHEGWRIVVDGAGPNGLPLLTDIATVHEASDGQQILILEDAASTSVPAAVAVANEGDSAKLSDHARATVGPLPVVIRDRQVDDATMTVGSKVLRSDAARFSKLDIGATVTIEGAGHHRTTIEQVADDTTVLLAAPALRTVVDGPADVWRPGSDCTSRLLTGLQTAESGTEPVEIVFGPGVYDFTALPTDTGALVAVGLNGLSGFTLRGAGRGATVLRLMPEQDLQGDSEGSTVADTHVIMARSCTDLRIAGLTVHGAYLTMAQGGVEQMHGVFLNAGCDGAVLDDVEVFQSGGDGVRLLGEEGNPVSRVVVDRCHLIQNHRSGIAVQREVHRMRVRRCSIDMTPPGEDACIDLEPTSAIPTVEAPSDVVIHFNTLVHGNDAMAVSLSGISPDRPSRRVRFANNTLTGGRLGGAHTEQLTVRANTLDAGPATLTGSLIHLHGRCVDLQLDGNQIVAPGQQADGISINELTERLTVVDNDVRTGGVGIEIVGRGDDVEVGRNQVIGDNQKPGIRVRTTGGTMHGGVRVEDNIVLDFHNAGIIVGPGGAEQDKLVSPVITGNTVDRQGAVPAGLTGIDLVGGTGQWVDAVVEDNEIDEAIPVPTDGPE